MDVINSEINLKRKISFLHVIAEKNPRIVEFYFLSFLKWTLQ